MDVGTHRYCRDTIFKVAYFGFQCLNFAFELSDDLEKAYWLRLSQASNSSANAMTGLLGPDRTR